MVYRVLEEKGKIVCKDCKTEVLINPIETDFGYFVPCPRCKGIAYEGEEKPTYIGTIPQIKKNYYFVS